MKIFLRDMKILKHVIVDMLKQIAPIEAVILGIWLLRNKISEDFIFVHGYGLPIIALVVLIGFMIGFLTLYFGEYRRYIADQFKEKEMNKKYSFFNSRFNK